MNGNNYEAIKEMSAPKSNRTIVSSQPIPSTII
jgi:hypothetical protein